MARPIPLAAPVTIAARSFIRTRSLGSDPSPPSPRITSLAVCAEKGRTRCGSGVWFSALIFVIPALLAVATIAVAGDGGKSNFKSDKLNGYQEAPRSALDDRQAVSSTRA